MIGVPVDCPACWADTTVIGQEKEPGYEIGPWWESLAGIPVQVTQYVPARISGLHLACGHLIPYPPWILRFPSPGVRPYFIRKEPDDA